MSPRRRGFTLIELLVVIGIIVLLIAIALPMVGRAWDMANQAKCKSNLKNLTHAFLAFAKDHDGCLPGSKYVWGSGDNNSEHWDWLFGQYSNWELITSNTIFDRLKTAPQYGTLWKYVSDSSDPANPSPAALRIYLCPSVRYQQAGSGIGSNGRFDYAAFSCFSGAPLKDINPVSELHFPLDPNKPDLVPDPGLPYSSLLLSSHFELVATPLICQEDSQWNINSNLEGQHSNTDQFSHIHNGGSFYGAIDGSVRFINEPDTDPANFASMGTHLWWQNGPISGQPVNLNGDSGWGWWSHR